jgi:MFS family permease
MTARAGVTIIFAVNGVLYGAWAARIAAVGNRLELGAGELGVALAFIAAGALIAMPIAGRAANRFGSNPATTVSLALFCVASALTPAAPSLALLCAACVLMGAAGGALDVTMNVQGVTVEDSRGQPILSSFHAAFSAGGLTGALIGAGSAAAGIDVRGQMAVLAALGLVVGLTAARALLPAAADAVGKRDAVRRGPRRIDSRLLLLGLLAFCCLLCEGAAADWSAVYVDRSLAASAAVAGLAYAAFSVTMVLGRLFGDALTKRFGSAALVRAGSVVSAMGLAAALVANAPGAALVGFACLGAGLSIVVPQVFRAAAATGDSGPALATVSTIGYTGFLAGPPLIGAIAELTSLPAALAVLPLLAAAMALLAPLTDTRRGEPAGVPGCELQPS